MIQGLLATFGAIARGALAGAGGRALAGAAGMGVRQTGRVASGFEGLSLKNNVYARGAQAAKVLVEHRFRGPQPAQQTGTAPQPAQVSQLAGRSGQMFGDLLGGRITPQAAQRQDVDEQAAANKEKSAQAETDAALAAAAAMTSVALATTTFGASLITLPFALKKFATAILDSREYLSHFNGRIAQAFARLKIQDVQLNVRTGAATASSTEALTTAVMEMKEAVQPIRESLINLINLVATGSAKVVTFFANLQQLLDGPLGDALAMAVPVVGLLRLILRAVENNEPKPMDDPFAKALDEIIQEAGRRKRPPIRPLGQDNVDPRGGPWGGDGRRGKKG